MRTLLIACGNPLRRDDGVAAEVLQFMAPSVDREMRVVHQLTPEWAEEIARFDRVIFIDAESTSEATTRATIEVVRSIISQAPLTHASTPAEIVMLSRMLFAFSGEALVCRIPARDFSPGEGLTADGMRMAHETADELEHIL